MNLIRFRKKYMKTVSHSFPVIYRVYYMSPSFLRVGGAREGHNFHLLLFFGFLPGFPKQHVQ